MKQRAVRFGVLSNPYRAVEPGQEFEHDEAMNWAEPVEAPAEAEPAAAPPPATKAKKKAPVEPEAAPDEADPI